MFEGLTPNGYRCILADCPWRFAAGTKSRPQHYKRMTDAELAALPVASLAHPEGCWLFAWVTSPKLFLAHKIITSWGFKYSARAFVWIKTTEDRKYLSKGLGYTTRKNAEDVLLYRIGMPKRVDFDVHEVIISPRREHSRKPEEAYRRIERFCEGPRAELFARNLREGWDSRGDELDKF